MQNIVFLSNNAPGYVPYERLVENGPIFIPISGADAPMLLSATQFYSTSYLCSETKEHWNSAFLSIGRWSSVLALWAAKHRRGVVEHVYHLQPGGEDDGHGGYTCQISKLFQKECVEHLQ